MIKLIIESLLIGYTFVMIMKIHTLVMFSIKSGKLPHGRYIWIYPSILVAICWFIHFYFK